MRTCIGRPQREKQIETIYSTGGTTPLTQAIVIGGFDAYAIVFDFDRSQAVILDANV